MAEWWRKDGKSVGKWKRKLKKTNKVRKKSVDNLSLKENERGKTTDKESGRRWAKQP